MDSAVAQPSNDDGSVMLCCDACEEWFHIACLAISPEQAATAKYFHCASCSGTGSIHMAGEVQPQENPYSSSVPSTSSSSSSYDSDPYLAPISTSTSAPTSFSSSSHTLSGASYEQPVNNSSSSRSNNNRSIMSHSSSSKASSKASKSRAKKSRYDDDSDSASDFTASDAESSDESSESDASDSDSYVRRRKKAKAKLVARPKGDDSSPGSVYASSSSGYHGQDHESGSPSSPPTAHRSRKDNPNIVVSPQRKKNSKKSSSSKSSKSSTKKKKKSGSEDGEGKVKTDTGRKRRRDAGITIDKTKTRPWTKGEIKLFLDGLEVCGRSWYELADYVGTRTRKEVASRAQRHFIHLYNAGLPLPAKVRESGEGYTISGKPLDPNSSAALRYNGPRLERDRELLRRGEPIPQMSNHVPVPKRVLANLKKESKKRRERKKAQTTAVDEDDDDEKDGSGYDDDEEDDDEFRSKSKKKTASSSSSSSRAYKLRERRPVSLKEDADEEEEVKGEKKRQRVVLEKEEEEEFDAIVRQTPVMRYGPAGGKLNSRALSNPNIRPSSPVNDPHVADSIYGSLNETADGSFADDMIYDEDYLSTNYDIGTEEPHLASQAQPSHSSSIHSSLSMPGHERKSDPGMAGHGMSSIDPLMHHHAFVNPLSDTAFQHPDPTSFLTAESDIHHPFAIGENHYIAGPASHSHSHSTASSTIASESFAVSALPADDHPFNSSFSMNASPQAPFFASDPMASSLIASSLIDDAFTD